MKKDISRLKSNRSAYFLMGLGIALGLCFMAMNYTSYQSGHTLYSVASEPHGYLEMIPITRHPEERSTPPPVFEQVDTEEFVEDTPDFIEELPEPVTPEPVEPTYPTEPRTGWPIEPSAKPVKPTPPPLPEPEPEPEPTDDATYFAEHMPSFGVCGDIDDSAARKTCSDRALLTWVSEHMHYPNIARAAGIEGTVVAQFIIEKDGSISSVKIMREIGGGTTEEVKRILAKMPKWSPGKQNYRPVRVRFNMPFRFRLQD